MALRIDLHVHTSRYSKCSKLDPDRLVRHAVQMGLDGVVLTEHHHVWDTAEIEELVDKSGEIGFILLAGFEYTSSKGDVLIYGLTPEQAEDFTPGGPPEEAVERAKELGAACIAAHPTRVELGFDERIITLPLDAIEVRSVNLDEHEQRLAVSLANNVNIPPVTCSDAHKIDEVGRFTTDFLDPVQSIADLKEALKRGRFQPRPHGT